MELFYRIYELIVIIKQVAPQQENVITVDNSEANY